MRKTASVVTKVDTVIVRVRNLARAKAWYEEKLGLRAAVVADGERLVIFDPGGETSFTIWEWKRGERRPAAGAAPSFPIFYAADLAAAHRTLARRGVRVDSIQGDPRETQWFVFRDLDGNTLEMCHY